MRTGGNSSSFLLRILAFAALPALGLRSGYSVPAAYSISGHVYDQNTSLPVAGVAVTATPTAQRTTVSVVTNSSGAYQINGLTSETYAVFPNPASRGYADSAPTSRVVAVPPDASGVDFRLRSPEIGVLPTSFTFTVKQGETAESLLWISNSGSAPLNWSLSETAVAEEGGPLPGRTPIDVSLAVADRSEAGGNVRSAGPRILVYSDDFVHTAPNTYIDRALARLGVSYTAYYDNAFANFVDALTNSGPWDLVVFSDENYWPPASIWDALDEHVAAGGKLILFTWLMDENATLPIWDRMGVVFNANDNEPPDPVYWWQPEHVIFTKPERVPEFAARVGGLFEPYGQYVVALPGATALAGYTPGDPVAGRAALVLNAMGLTVFKGFSDCDNDADLDDDGIPDAVELWENTIGGFIDRVGWLYEMPSAGMAAIAGLSGVRVGVNAADLDVGDYRALLRINSNDVEDPVTTMPVTMNVLPGVPRLGVRPTPLDFGVVWIGYPQSRTVTLSNDGYSTLTIQSLAASGPDYAIVSSPSLPVLLSHRQGCDVTVRFAPHALGASTNTLVVRSNDPASSLAQVLLTGIGADRPRIALEPGVITTVTLYQDRTATRSLTIRNTGGSTLTVTALRDEETKPPRLNGFQTPPVGQPATPTPGQIRPNAQYVPGEVLVKYRKQVALAQAQAVEIQMGAQAVKDYRAVGVTRVQLAPGVAVADAVQRYMNSGLVEYAEPNYIRHLLVIPNDPLFNGLWGLHNVGQNGGTADADIDAPEGWDIAAGDGSVVVGAIDTGIDYTHPDLAANIWTNPGEIPGNGVDDDGNGYVDDVHGYDFANDDGDPMDDNGHGTHTAGTIGAVGNNAVGVAGVCWRVRIAALKVFDDQGYANDADLLEGLLYANKMGFQLTNNSWGGPDYSQAFKDAIDAAGARGALFVAAAGNDTVNTDVSPQYPSCYSSPNIISVCATDNKDHLAFVAGWWGSNWGPTTVDLGAPGLYILSTVPGNDYGVYSGTSMATPHVTGAAALLWSYVPRAPSTTIKAAILNGAQPLAELHGKCLTGARLSLPNALNLAQLYTGAAWLWEAPPRTMPLQIPAGEAANITVGFDARIPQAIPGPGAFFGRVIVASNDPTTTEAAVDASMVVHPAPDLRCAGQRLDDDTSPPSVGDGDGYAEPGETIEVWVDLRNTGLLAATDVAGTFTMVGGTSATLSNPTIRWPDVPGGQTRRSSASLVLIIAPSCPAGTRIGLRGQVNDADPQFGPWEISLTTITVVRTYTIAGRVRDAGTHRPIEGAAVRRVTQGALFADNFEDGDFKGWIEQGGSYIREATAATAANGTVFSFTQTGGSNAHFNGVKRLLDHVRPNRMEFWVRTSAANTASGYFVAGDDNLGDTNSGLIWFYCNSSGRLWVNDNDTVLCAANTWYHIEFVLDWSTRTFDYRVDGSLIAARIAFRTAETADLTQLHLYNFAFSQAWWDEIRIDGEMVEQRPTAADGSYQFAGLDAGLHTLTATKAPYGASSPTAQLITSPPDASRVNFDLLAADVDVRPTSFTFTATEGMPVISTATLTVANVGFTTLTWSLEEEARGFSMLSAGDPAPWLNESPASGVCNSGTSTSVAVCANSAGLEAGVYRANLLVAANDPDEPVTTIPVTLRILDPTPPTAPGRPVPDKAPYTSRTTVVYTWTPASDPESGIKQYFCQVGTAPGAGNIFNGVTTTTLKSVTGADGQTLYCRARAVNGRDMNGPWSANSTPTRIDVTRPSLPGTPQDGGDYTSITLVTFNWTASTDGTSGSGVASYDAQVGTTPGGSNLFNGNVGSARTKTVTGANGQRLYARVRARDRAGNIGAWSANSDGITVDTVRPRLSSVVARDYLTLDVTFNESVRNHDLLRNYACIGGLRLTAAIRLSETHSRLYTSAQTPGTSYTLRVGSGVADRAGSPMDAAYSRRSFRGGAVTEARTWELYR